MVARQPVGPDATEEKQDDDRDLARRKHDPDVRRRAVQRVQDREGERDGRHRAAKARRRLADEQKPELPLAERAETTHDARLSQ